MLGNIMVLTVLAVVVALAVRSLRKDRRSGGGCSGDCALCGCCHGGQKK